jgi:drug/metabolite transporter (DMT)-like permease
MPERNGAAYLAFVIVSVVWGTTYLAIRIALETVPTLLLTGIRFTVAGAVLLAICLMRGDKMPRGRSDYANILLAGVLMVGIGNLAVVWAEHWVPSGFTALLVATSPFWMALLELMRGNTDRLSPQKIMGLVIGFSGVALLVAPRLAGTHLNLPFLMGVLALQIGSIAWNIGSVRSKYHVTNAAPLVSAGLQMLLAGLLLDLAGLLAHELPALHFTTRSFLALAYLTVAGSVIAYTAYVYALSKLPTATVSLYAYINPAIAVVAGWLFASEALGWREIVAMIVILAGVALVQPPFGGRRRGAPVAEHA